MSARAVAPTGITPELLLEVFDLPVTFHRCLVPITGGVTAALMLSQAIRATEDLDSEACGWFTRSQEQWSEETGLTRREQETARRSLLLITHRVAAAARCQRILVLDQGRVVESGSHDELLRLGGIYAGFAREQKRESELEELGQSDVPETPHAAKNPSSQQSQDAQP